MKKILIKVAAVMALVWYSLGIIGFDVHTCNASGRSFIATFIAGTACQDIHPDHCCAHEHHGCKCAHHQADETAVGEPDQCCTDDYQALAITGTTSGSSREFEDWNGLCFHCTADSAYGAETKLQIVPFRVFWMPDSGYRISDCQAVLSVWRI